MTEMTGDTIPDKANVVSRLRSNVGDHLLHKQCIEGNMKPFRIQILKIKHFFCNYFLLQLVFITCDKPWKILRKITHPEPNLVANGMNRLSNAQIPIPAPKKKLPPYLFVKIPLCVDNLFLIANSIANYYVLGNLNKHIPAGNCVTMYP
jgi:hypothetical protein